MSTPSHPYFSIIIVGAGPTSLTMGNLLSTCGIDVLILERKAGLNDLPKAISIDDEGLRICQAMGLSHAVIEHVLLDIDAYYMSGKHYLTKVSPTSKRNGYPLSQHFTSLRLKLRCSTVSNVSRVSVYSFSTPSKHLNKAIQMWCSTLVLLKAFSKHLLALTYLPATAQKALSDASLVLLCAVRPLHKNGW
jgi:hypothetical protein